jgi:hypothetical protein
VRTFRSIAPVLVLALAVVSCGGGSDGEEDEEAVRGAVDGLYAALAEKDADGVCEALAHEQREVVAKGDGTKPRASCEQVMGVALNYVGRGKGLEDADEAQVTDVELEGGRAVATVEFKGRSAPVELRKEAGDWKVSTLNLERASSRPGLSSG